MSLKLSLKRIKDSGQFSRIHGNTGRKTYNALKYQVIKSAVYFLDNLARLNGIPMSSAQKGRNEEPPVFLSFKETKKAIHTTHRESYCESGHRPLGLTAFRKTNRQCLCHIKIPLPREYVCSTCELLRRRVSKASTEDERLEASFSFIIHKQKAQLERECYINDLKKSTEELEGHERCQGPVPPNSTNLSHVHYTIDYCQSVTLPHYARQIGQFYIIGRKVNIFAVRIDGVPVQYNYLIDENQSIGTNGSGCQGPNGVISMLHGCLFRNGYGERRCVIHADNCAGQNKNQFMIGYLLWRIHQGLHEEIELKMQVPGHTRCRIDGAFGHIKKLYRRTDVETITDLADVVNKSSKTNRAVLFQDSRGEQNWVWHDWKSFIKQFYKPLKGIRKLRVFRFTSTDKTSVFVKESSDGNEVKVSLLKTIPPVEAYPEIIVPAGLTDARIQYLRRHVRPRVSEASKDYIAPPTQEE